MNKIITHGRRWPTRQNVLPPAHRPRAAALLAFSAFAGLISLPACSPGSEPDSLGEVSIEEQLSVGVAAGDESQEFGHVLDVRSAHDGSFFVLDVQGPAISWYGADGTLRGGIAVHGEGPGELASATAIAVHDHQRLAVVDPDNGRIGLYRFDGDGLGYEGEIAQALSPLNTGGRSICSIGDRLFLRELRGELLIHELDATGQTVRSFEAAVATPAEEFGPFVDVVAPQRNAGHLLCLDEPGLIVSMSRYLPAVRAFTPDGDLLWETELANFRPWQIGRAHV